MTIKSVITIGLFRGAKVLPLSLVRKIGRIVGRILIALDKRTNRVIKRNIEICLSHLTKHQQESLRKKRLANMGQTLFEFAHVFLKSKESVCSLCNSLPDTHEFAKAMQSGNGTIVLVPHIGNWEVMNFYLSQFQQRTILYRPLRNPEIDKLFCKIREKLCTKLVPIDNTGVRQLMQALRRKEMVVMLPDQVPNLSGGVYAPFFTEQALTMTLANRLAVKADANVFIGVAYQTDKGFDVSIEPMQKAFYSTDLSQSTAELNRHVEQLILRHPAQNQWEYKRFKFGPNFLERDLYSKQHLNL
ncbi:MAG: lysophospholipid acyltransferase family protein [Gammaproteobacteria bacterium]|nr:lysophospholipid acyltransferase family protein [Gammaproteobacteria bacterium]